MAATKTPARKPATRKPAARKPATAKTQAAKTQAAKAPPARQSTASRALGIASFGALAIAVGAALVEGFRRFTARGDAGHAAPDLALDQPRPSANDRAPVDFRPDPTAAVPASEREGLRPATGPVANDARDFAVAD
jgi:hypothetical protein